MNARLALRLIKSGPLALRSVPKRIWPSLAAPIFPGETDVIARAQSILTGPLIGQCQPLSISQARDVIAWFNPKKEMR